MKKWCFFLILLLLLTGCGKQEWPASPYDLEVEYGDSGVQAMKGSASWFHAGGSVETKDVDPLEILSEIPFVNQTNAKKLNLLFAEKPDTLEISWSQLSVYRASILGGSQGSCPAWRLHLLFPLSAGRCNR